MQQKIGSVRANRRFEGEVKLEREQEFVIHRADVLTVGETMIRFSPPGDNRLGQTTTSELHVAGSESNVAAGLAALGHSVRWCSRLPDQPLGRLVASKLSEVGINVDSVRWTSADDRVGLFFYEAGVFPRGPVVVYDRAQSAASGMQPGDFGPELLAEHKHLHLSGITPSLSTSCAEMCRLLFEQARTLGLSTSFDVNYRAKLWDAPMASAAISDIARGVDLLLCSADDAETLFAVSGSGVEVAQELGRKLNARTTLVTGGLSGSCGSDAQGTATASPTAVEKTVERLGSGDAFAAGAISSFLSGKTLADHLALGNAAAAFKRTMSGDMLRATRAEILTLVAPSAQVKRWR